MSARPRVFLTLVVAVIALFGAALGGALLAPVGHAAPASVTAASHPSTAPVGPSASTGTTYTPHAPGASAAAKLQAAIQASHVDTRKIYPPNLLYSPTLHNGMIVKPSYPQAPEPVGLADYGVNNSTGTPSSYTLDTTSYRAGVDLQSVTPYYLATGVPEGFTSQLNVVLTNVTLFGNSSYTFWTQNVFFYDAYSSQLFVENNIWNFSSAPPSPQPVNTFFYLPGYTNGSDNPGIGYYAAGTPTFTGITTPFSIEFYLNATTLVYNGTAYTEVNFAFDLYNGAGVQVMSDQYDRALFNNTGGGATIPQAHFHIDGTNLTPTGYIPYDAEVMLGGPGGGSTATFNAINGTMTLQHWDAGTGTYVNEPSAWSSGSETGETAVGVAEYYDSNGVVHLGAGPELIQPFWNSSATAAAGAAVLSGTFSPSNAWAFVTNAGSYNISDSAWSALPTSGNYVWNLTQGTYTVKLMLSDYDPVISSALVLTSGTTTSYSVTLTADMSMGVYTPLYAWSNSQLAAISSSGSGTVSSPYVLVNNEYSNLSGEFAAMNDYAFPAYVGISLIGTSDFVEILNPAPFTVDFWGAYLNLATYYGVPTSNELSTWMFETSNVSIVGGTIAGWFSGNQQGFPYAPVLLWNTTNILVLGVTFDVTSNGITTYGGTNNSFVGNTFIETPVAGNVMIGAAYLYYNGAINLYGWGAPGIIENEGGDSIWNNNFDTSVTMFVTNANVYDDLYPSVAPVSFVNTYNLPAPVPANTIWTINGIAFTGAVGSYPWACGNEWSDYIPGVTPLPYDENIGIPIIQPGGDSCPAGSLGQAVFEESGLPGGTTWGVNVGGTALSGSTNTLSTVMPVGNYSVTVTPVSGYTAAISTTTVAVPDQSGIVGVTVVFTSSSPKYGTLAGSVSPAGATVWVDGTQVTLVSGSWSNTLMVGVHSVEALAAGYYPYYNNVTVSNGATTTLRIAMNALPPGTGPNGTLSLSVSPATATAWVNGVQVTLIGGAYSASLTPGVYAVEVMAGGYYTYYNNATVLSNGTTSLAVSLHSVPPGPGADGTLSLTVTPATATVWVDGTQVTLTGGLYSAAVAPGVHSIEVMAAGYHTYYNNASVSSNLTTSVMPTLIAYAPGPGSDGTLSLTVTTGSATVWVDGAQVTLQNGVYSASVSPTTHSVEVQASGYYTYFNNVTVSSNATKSVTITLNAVGSGSSSSSSNSNGISSTAWALIGVLAVLAVIFLITTVIYMGRSKGGSGGSNSGNMGSSGSGPDEGGSS